MNKRVIIIGGGIVGCLSALEFKKKGFDVTIIEKSDIGHESSSAAAGILYPLMPWKYDDALYELSLGATEFYAELSKKLLKDFNKDIEYIKSGLLLLPPYNEDEFIKWSKKSKTSFLKKNNSILLPEVAQVNPKKLMSSIKELVVSMDIKIFENLAVTSIKTNTNFIDAVYTNDNKEFMGDVFVLSAGAWSSIIYEKLATKIKPIRGQIIEYFAKDLIIENILYSQGIYILQRKNRSIIAGSTLEDVGFSDKNLQSKFLELDRKAKDVLEDLQKCSIDRTWHGFRPGVDDNYPIVSKDENFGNMFIHSGHFRYGITTAPATTKILMSYF
jgi:glycine oxidase